MKNIAIFASGTGTNAENIIRYFKASADIQVRLVISSRRDAQVIERAQKLGVPVRVIQKQEFKYEENVLPLLRQYHIDLIVLAGFLLFVPEYLTEAFPNSIINIHPSLLPKYGGKGMYGMHVHEAVKENNEKESGITIHHVSQEYDQGQIIAQFSTPLEPSDTPEEIAQKVHALEYKHYPRVIEKLIGCKNKSEEE